MRPDLKFNRSIGENVGKTYQRYRRALVARSLSEAHHGCFADAEDEKILAEIIKGKDWVAQIQLN